ncbi:MAG: GGDEF domain-containing protein [Erysipelotrichia bacterium]|nr:GGDEF domain-containing protein [Erysipelotrichia bacterium]NCC55344.1 GGDEF domain-containing protein [Erysipelotrichia bacterium]
MFHIKDIDPSLKKYALMNFHEYYRVIDVHTHTVYNYCNGTLIPTEEKCYEIWNRNIPCANCTSKRANLCKKHVVKIAFSNEDVYLVYSLPVTIDKGEYALELIQNVSDSFMINSEITQNTSDVNTVIGAFNDLLMKDSFTLLYNKQYLNKKLIESMKRRKENHYPIMIAVLDIDFFKDVNDSYGHIFGDKVLLAIAEELHFYKDKNIYCARLGGDEFAIVFENKTYEECNQICLQLQQKLSTLTISDQNKYSIQISYGISSLKDGDSIDTWLHRADQDMYKMKKAHHNK